MHFILQELDLLDIRLASILMLISSSSSKPVKPSAQSKDFVFEQLPALFKIPTKIEYQKITDFHSDYQSVQQHLGAGAHPSSENSRDHGRLTIIQKRSALGS